VVSSEIFRDFRLSDISRFGDLHPDTCINTYSGAHMQYYSNVFYGLDLSDPCLKIGMEKLTVREVKYLVEEADRRIMDTQEGAEYKIDKIFGTRDKSKKWFGPPPGTVRFFSRDHICYCAGKSWKKITLLQ
jgi:hypothetical protein